MPEGESKEREKEINYWPYAIVGMILTVVLLSIWTIKIAVRNPVQLDRSFMQTYQQVDANYNEIIAKQKAFEKKYTIQWDSTHLKMGENRIALKVVDKRGEPVSGAIIEAIVARPTSHTGEVKLNSFKEHDALYISEPFKIVQMGRWNIDVKVKVANDVGYKTYKSFVK